MLGAGAGGLGRCVMDVAAGLSGAGGHHHRAGPVRHRRIALLHDAVAVEDHLVHLPRGPGGPVRSQQGRRGPGHGTSAAPTPQRSGLGGRIFPGAGASSVSPGRRIIPVDRDDGPSRCPTTQRQTSASALRRQAWRPHQRLPFEKSTSIRIAVEVNASVAASARKRGPATRRRHRRAHAAPIWEELGGLFLADSLDGCLVQPSKPSCGRDETDRREEMKLPPVMANAGARGLDLSPDGWCPSPLGNDRSVRDGAYDLVVGGDDRAPSAIDSNGNR